MTDLIRLDPHEALPSSGSFKLVITRFGEDDPNAVITEILTYDDSGRSGALPLRHDGTPLGFEEAVKLAVKEAGAHGIGRVYAVDRTAGKREQQIISRHGDHSVGSDKLLDDDAEDGVHGSTMLDRQPLS